MECVQVHDDDGVRTVVLNRPESLNAINYDLLDDLERVARQSHNDPSVRAVVIRGSGRAFCAGDDLKGMGTERIPLPEDDPNLRAELGYPRFILALRHLAKPVVAQVHGYALGAGCDLALSCDLVYAASDATFGLVFAQRGMVSGTCLLPRLVGYQKACELLFSGRTFDAEEARRLGLVNRVVPAERLDEEVTAEVRRLAEGPTTALGLMKRAINQGLGVPLETAVDLQRHVVAASFRTFDYAEGKRAFQERRPANYRGN
ncbi:MAG: hypothetical protein GEV03_29120 [Streptosporangiales bacterium]|nr:hypothetical protein [Streptosporangiales bacterium]